MNATILYGWVSQPNGRGTLDIVWSCLSTSFFCSWCVLCLNIPAADEGDSRQLARKLKYVVLAIVFPELLLFSAFGQNIAARSSVERLEKLGFGTWTLQHAFYANMGGIMLDAPDCQTFPINASQLGYLVENKYVDFSQETITRIQKDIRDKNKNNGFTRLITVIQVGWFVLQFIGRVAQGLAVTTFELTTIAFVVCTLPTFECWRKKPSDLQTAGIFLIPNISIDMILHRARERNSGQAYRKTPLDFADDPPLVVPVWYPLLWRMGMCKDRCKKIVDRLSNDRITPLKSDWEDWSRWMQWSIVIEQVFRLWVVSYGAVHLAAWNFFFPTNAERIIWLVSGFTVTFLLLAYMIGASTVAELKMLSWLKTPDRSYTSASIHSVIIYLGGTSIYVLARLFLIAESLAALRALPASTYDSVVWQNFPHI